MDLPRKSPKRIHEPRYVLFDTTARQMHTCTDLGAIAPLFNRTHLTMMNWFAHGETEKAYKTLHIFKVHSHISGNRKGHYHDKLLGKKTEEEN